MIKGDMKRTTPFQCFRKPAPEAAAASSDTLQTDARNVTKIVSNKLTTEMLHVSIQTQRCLVYEQICILNGSSESIQLPIHKDSLVPE